jgi:DNA-binding beta-propeller fold protein YncE
MSKPNRMFRKIFLKIVSAGLLIFLLTAAIAPSHFSATSNHEKVLQKEKKYLYVAVPGIRNYLEYGGHGILVYDIDDNYRLVKRIPAAGLNKEGKPSNVKGVDVSLATQSIYITTLEALQCIDLATGNLKWEKAFEGGCDRMSISPNGKIIYLPSLEKEHWNVVDAESGALISKVVTNPGAHNTIYGLNGKEVYLGGLRSVYLGVANPDSHKVTKQVGPFSGGIRPFTVNSRQTFAYVNVNGLLGFEVGDLKTGKLLYRIEVPGYQTGPVKRHSCPSHGIGLTPDEKEIWVCDSYNQRLHIYNTANHPQYKTSIQVKDQPGWITFSLDGKHAYPSTGEIIDVKSRKVIASLKDEQGKDVQSEKMVEIHFRNNRAIRAGDQFGIGRLHKK